MIISILVEKSLTIFNTHSLQKHSANRQEEYKEVKHKGFALRIWKEAKVSTDTEAGLAAGKEQEGKCHYEQYPEVSTRKRLE